MIRFKIKLAFRNLLRNKLYSSLIIGGFSIGFTACILIMLFYNTQHNVDTHFANYQNIYRLCDAKKQMCRVDYQLNKILSENYPDIEKNCPVEYTADMPTTIKDTESKNYVRISNLITTNNGFFDLFSIPIVASISDKPFNELGSAVLSESMAKKLFGAKNPLGKTLKEDFFTATVTAVVEDLPENSSFKADLFLNIENRDFQMSRQCNNGKCIYPVEQLLVLKTGINSENFTAKLNRTIRQYNSTTDSLAMQKLTDIYLSPVQLDWEGHTKGNPKLLLVFLFIAFLIILLSSINYLNYTLSMQFAKMKEIGINKTNGANRFQLIADTFVEVSLGIFIALIISVILTWTILPYSGTLFGKTIHLTDVNIFQLFPAFLCALIGIVVLNSLAPVIWLSRFKITDFLSGNRKRNGKQAGKQVLLIFQLTTSIALIVIVLIIFKQLQFVKHHDLGFEEEHLVRIELPYLIKDPQPLKNEMAKLPFVAHTALSQGYPGHINMIMGSGTEGEFMLNCIYVGDDYLETMGIKLLDGRSFLNSDQNQACLINQAAIDRYGWDNIEGKKFNNGRTDGYTIVGKVNNFNVESLRSAMTPVALLYKTDESFNTLSLRLTPGDVLQQMEQVKKMWKSLIPEDPMEFTFYSDQFQAMYTQEDRLVKSISFFSFIAIVLTCMGILGQIFTISLNRNKEIGIRKVNGAKIFEILILLNSDFVKWIVVAFVLATPIAYYAMNKWLESFAYKTTLSWWIFALAGLIAMGITLLTVSWQSWRTATRNPVEALRYE